MYRKVHQKAHPTWTESWLKQPANNAKAAYLLSNGGRNWRPWEAYTNGAYRKYLGAAQNAVRSAGSIPPTKTNPVAKGVTVSRVLAIAASQIGYTERPSNRTKYWTDLKINQGQPWCGGFVTWVLWKAGYSLPKIRSMMGSNPYHVWSIKAAAIKKKRWTSTPKPGYLAIFTYSHVEIVEKVLSDGRVQTIGGNTSSGSRGSQNNGGGVYRKPRSRRSIQGYVRIDYDAYTVVETTSPDWSPGVDTEKADLDSSGILTVNGIFNAATSEILAKYLGFDGSTAKNVTAYWKRVEAVAGFPVRWQDGALDTETVQFLQWISEQKVTGNWNTRVITTLQGFLNEFTRGNKQSYANMMMGVPR